MIQCDINQANNGGGRPDSADSSSPLQNIAVFGYWHLCTWNKCLIRSTKVTVKDPHQCYCNIHSHAVPVFSASLQSPVYNMALFITIFQQSFCHSSNTVTAGAPLFSVLLGWKLLLILTQHFLHVLHNKCESSGRPCEPLQKVLTMPSRLANVGKSA